MCGKVNSRFKKDLKLQVHLHKAFFSDGRFLDSLHKSFLNQTTLDLRKENWTFLNQEFTVVSILSSLCPCRESGDFRILKDCLARMTEVKLQAPVWAFKAQNNTGASSRSYSDLWTLQHPEKSHLAHFPLPHNGCLPL